MTPEILPGRRIRAVVETVLIADGGGFQTRTVDRLDLAFDGIPGDTHTGATRRSGGREPWYPRRTEIKNERQVSIVALDELAVIAAALSVDAIRPEWIGANLVLGGLPELSWLPAGTRLLFARGATITIAGQNSPCRIAGRSIGLHYPDRDDMELAFPEKGKHRRGLVGWVEKPGTVFPGEALVAFTPTQRLYR